MNGKAHYLHDWQIHTSAAKALLPLPVAIVKAAEMYNDGLVNYITCKFSHGRTMALFPKTGSWV